MWRLSWVIRMSPEFNPMYFHKREAGGTGRCDRHREGDIKRGQRLEDAGSEDRSGMATRQGMPAATRSLKRQEMDSPQEPLEKASPCDTWVAAH